MMYKMVAIALGCLLLSVISKGMPVQLPPCYEQCLEYAVPSEPCCTHNEETQAPRCCFNVGQDMSEQMLATVASPAKLVLAPAVAVMSDWQCLPRTGDEQVSRIRPPPAPVQQAWRSGTESKQVWLL